MSNLASKARLLDPHRYRFGFSGILIVTFGLLCITVTTLYVMWTSLPEYWERNRTYLGSRTPEELETIAVNFQNTFLNELNDPYGFVASSEESHPRRSIPVRYDQVNAWLSQALPKWLANQNISLPPWLGGFMLSSESGNLVTAFRVQLPQFDQVVSLVISPSFRADGRLDLRIESIRAGIMPIPRKLLVHRIAEGMKHSGDNALADSLVKLIDDPVLNPVIELPGSRLIRVTDCHIHEDRLVLVVCDE